MDLIYNEIKICYDSGEREKGMKIFDKLCIDYNISLDKKIYIDDMEYFLLILEKISIIAFYIDGYKDIGYRASEYLLFNKFPNINKNMVHSNLIFYINKLENTKYINIDSEKILLDNPNNNYIYYAPLNPSILKTNDGYIINLRYSNFYSIEGKSWHSMETDNIVRTKNYILHCDKDFNILSSNEIIDKSWKYYDNNKNNNSGNILGFEDCILINKNNEIYFSCTTLDTIPIGTPKQTLCKLSELSENNTLLEGCIFDAKYEITDVMIMNGINDFDRAEKNWMYINDYDDNFKFIHSYDPITIIEVENIKNKEICKVNIISEIETDLDFSRFRGSGYPIKYSNETFLSVIHEVIFRTGDNRRYYVHRFILYDNNYKIIKISKSFYFDHLGIEFCRGISESHNLNEIILTVGIEDKEARIYTIDTHIISNLLIDINNYVIYN